MQKPNKTRQRSDKRKENDRQEKMKLVRFTFCLFCFALFLFIALDAIASKRLNAVGVVTFNAVVGAM